jgi:hypothetical protein
MNIDKFKHQHKKIYTCIDALRRHSISGIAENASEIAGLVVSMSSVIKLHLAVEDRVLYPALRASQNTALAKAGDAYQAEMEAIAASYDNFARKWNTAANVKRHPEHFRTDANTVLKILYQRIQREDRDFYPAVEAA